MNIQPAFNKILISPNHEKEITEGGIVIPDVAKEKPTIGIVVSVGTDDDIKVKVGDKVIFSNIGAREIIEEGKNFVLVKETDIIGIINDNKSLFQ